MARRRSFADSWALARSYGIKKDQWAESLEISRHHADDLTSGRVKPKLGEYLALGGGKRNTPWLIRYKVQGGDYAGFYTGTGMSYDELLDSGIIYDIAEWEEEYPLDHVVAVIRRTPAKEGVIVWSTSGKTRGLQRRRKQDDEGYWD